MILWVWKGKALNNPLIQLDDYTDGARSPDDKIWGTYLHGIFESASACNTILNWAGLERPTTPDYHDVKLIWNGWLMLLMNILMLIVL